MQTREGKARKCCAGDKHRDEGKDAERVVDPQEFRGDQHREQNQLVQDDDPNLHGEPS